VNDGFDLNVASVPEPAAALPMLATLAGRHRR